MGTTLPYALAIGLRVETLRNQDITVRQRTLSAPVLSRILTCRTGHVRPRANPNYRVGFATEGKRKLGKDLADISGETTWRLPTESLETLRRQDLWSALRQPAPRSEPILT